MVHNPRPSWSILCERETRHHERARASDASHPPPCGGWGIRFHMVHVKTVPVYALTQQKSIHSDAFCCVSARRGSNPRSSPWQGDVLPLYHSRIIQLCMSFGKLRFPQHASSIIQCDPQIVNCLNCLFCSEIFRKLIDRNACPKTRISTDRSAELLFSFQTLTSTFPPTAGLTDLSIEERIMSMSACPPCSVTSSVLAITDSATRF